MASRRVGRQRDRERGARRLSAPVRRVAAHGGAVRARAAARLHRHRRHAARTRRRSCTACSRAASTCSCRSSASRSRSRRRRRSCAAFARRSAENPGLALDGILLTMVEPGNPASERVAAYVREQLPRGLVLDMSVPRTRGVGRRVRGRTAGRAALAGRSRGPGVPSAGRLPRRTTRVIRRFVALVGCCRRGCVAVACIDMSAPKGRGVDFDAPAAVAVGRRRRHDARQRRQARRRCASSRSTPTTLRSPSVDAQFFVTDSAPSAHIGRTASSSATSIGSDSRHRAGRRRCRRLPVTVPVTVAPTHVRGSPADIDTLRVPSAGDHDATSSRRRSRHRRHGCAAPATRRHTASSSSTSLTKRPATIAGVAFAGSLLQPTTGRQVVDGRHDRRRRARAASSSCDRGSSPTRHCGPGRRSTARSSW